MLKRSTWDHTWSQKEGVSGIKYFYWVPLYRTIKFLSKHQIPTTPTKAGNHKELSFNITTWTIVHLYSQKDMRQVRPLWPQWKYDYRPQRSWGKVIFSQASVILSTGGCLLWGVSGPGVSAPRGGCLVPGGVWSWGVSAPGGAWSRGGAWWRPRQGQLLLRAVRILLECILVCHNFHQVIHLEHISTHLTLFCLTNRTWAI